MTVELTSSNPRSKRRKLPRRNIIDYEYVAPTKNVNLDQNLASLPSARLRSVLSEVWGGSTTNIIQVNQPIVIHHEKSTSTKKQQQPTFKTGTKSLLDKLKEHEKKVELDLSQVVIIPPSKGIIKNGEGVSSLHPVKTNVYNNIEEKRGVEEEEEEEELTNIYNQQQQTQTSTATTIITTTASSPPSSTGILSEPMDLDHEQKVDDINDDRLKHDCTTISSPHVFSDDGDYDYDKPSTNDYNNNNVDIVKTMHKFSNETNGILLSEGNTMIPFKSLLLPLEKVNQSGNAIDSPIILDNGDENEIYITAEEEEEEEEEETVLVNKEKDYIVNNKSIQEEIITQSDKIDDVHMETLLLPNQSEQDTMIIDSSPNEILNKWKSKKHKDKHGMLNMLKKSTALDWIENGHDLDSRKRNVGKIRKQQLQKKLNKPFLERKNISVSTWSTSPAP